MGLAKHNIAPVWKPDSEPRRRDAKDDDDEDGLRWWSAPSRKMSSLRLVLCLLAFRRTSLWSLWEEEDDEEERWRGRR